MRRTARRPHQAAPRAALDRPVTPLQTPSHAHALIRAVFTLVLANQRSKVGTCCSGSAQPTRPVGLSAFKQRKELDAGVLAQGRAGMESGRPLASPSLSSLLKREVASAARVSCLILQETSAEDHLVLDPSTDKALKQRAEHYWESTGALVA